MAARVRSARAEAGSDPLRHIEVEATPRDRSFTLWFTGTWLACWAALTLLAVLVDPLGKHGTGLLQPLVPNDRDIKAAAYDRLTPRPQALILGSSRVMMLSPACLAQAVGVPAFNFGLNSARVEDYAAALRFAESRGPIRRILVGVDPEAFHNAVGPDDRLLSSKAFSPFLSAAVRAPWWKRLYDESVDALTWETLAGSTRVLRFALFGGRPEATYTFDGAGLIHEAAKERLVQEGRFDQAPMITASVQEYTVRYAGFTSLSETRTAEFEALLAHAHAAGIMVDAFIPPLHPDLIAGLAGTTLADRTRDTDALLAEDERRGWLRFARLPTLASFDADPALFFDGAHMMKANGARFMAAIYRTPVCAVQ